MNNKIINNNKIIIIILYPEQRNVQSARDSNRVTFGYLGHPISATSYGLSSNMILDGKFT